MLHINNKEGINNDAKFWKKVWRVWPPAQKRSQDIKKFCSSNTMHAKHDDDQQRYDAYFVLMKLPISNKTLLFIGILAQAVAINIEHGKEETDRASSSLRGFKSDHIIEKLHWTTQKSGYQHWNNGQGNGRDRNRVTPDYSLTEKELLDTAIASKQAATSANELADAAANEDYDAIKVAVGKLNAAAYLAKAEAELACAYLPAETEEEEDDDNKPDVDNLLQNVSHIEAIANAIAYQAKKTVDAAELAVTACRRKELVSAAVFHTKSQADRVASMVLWLIMLMIGDAGSGPNVN